MVRVWFVDVQPKTQQVKDYNIYPQLHTYQNSEPKSRCVCRRRFVGLKLASGWHMMVLTKHAFFQ